MEMIDPGATACRGVSPAAFLTPSCEMYGTRSISARIDLGPVISTTVEPAIPVASPSHCLKRYPGWDPAVTDTRDCASKKPSGEAGVRFQLAEPAGSQVVASLNRRW